MLDIVNVFIKVVFLIVFNVLGDLLGQKTKVFMIHDVVFRGEDHFVYA